MTAHTVWIQFYTGEWEESQVELNEMTVSNVTEAINEVIGGRTPYPDQFTFTFSHLNYNEDMRRV